MPQALIRAAWESEIGPVAITTLRGGGGIVSYRESYGYEVSGAALSCTHLTGVKRVLAPYAALQ